MIPVTSPRTLDEAYAVLATRERGLRVLAGGTDFMVAVNAGQGLERIGRVLDISRVAGLRGAQVEGGVLRLGSLTTYTDLLGDAAVAQHFPALGAVAREVGAWAIQNRGTLGGNVCNASPAGDTLPLLLAADARFVLGGPRGERVVEAADFFVGYRKTQLAADELLLRVEIPPGAGEQVRYRKVGTRKAQSISRVLVAVRGRERIAAGCVAPVPLRCRNAEAAAAGGGDVRAALLRDIAPIDDVRASAAYRARVAGNVLVRLLHA